MWIATLFVLGTLPVPEDQPFLLRRKFATAEGERYTFTSEIKNSVELPAGSDDQSYTVSLKGTVSARCIGVDEHGVKIETTSIMDTITVSGPMAVRMPPMAKPTSGKFYGTLDILNRMKFSDAKGAVNGRSLESESVRAGGACISPIFPAEMVTLGSTWKITLQPSPLSDSKSPSSVEYTLSARDRLNGVATLVILASSDMTLAVKTGIKMKMILKLRGKIWIDPTTGRTLRAEVSGTTTSKAIGQSFQATEEETTVYIAKL